MYRETEFFEWAWLTFQKGHSILTVPSNTSDTITHKNDNLRVYTYFIM